MCDEKLRSDEVPQKFSEWLLAMGCPPETVPSLEKVSQMCRGQYYMVWRSLMEHVYPKDEIRHKRLTVFTDDVKKCKYKNVFTDRNSTVATPKELSLWQKQKEVNERLTETEARVTSARDNLQTLTDKISSKLSQRNLARSKAEDLHRRVFLLQRLTEELATRKENLLETRSIADALVKVNEGDDAEARVNSCMSVLRRPPVAEIQANDTICAHAASSSLVSNHNDSDTEEQLIALVRCRGDALWPILYEKRNSLITALSSFNGQSTLNNKRETPQSVLSKTAGLHCSLALEAMKNRILIKQTQKRLAALIPELSKYLSGDSCELLVTRCEESGGRARVTSLRASLDDVTSRDDVFACSGACASGPAGKLIVEVDRAIETKKAELEKLILSLTATESKIQNVKECLVNVFNGFHKDSHTASGEVYKGNQNVITQESISLLRSYYELRREKRASKAELSIGWDTSEQSLTTDIDPENTKFVDELKVYLNKFNLEKNRKLVLESGEKVWIFETLQSSLDRIHGVWLANDISTPLLCPSLSLCANIRALTDLFSTRGTLEALTQMVNNGRCKVKINDVVSREEEEKALDKIKKSLKENIQNLQKTSKTLELGKHNLKFWSSNQIKKYVASNRSVNGKSFREFEGMYIENLGLSM